MAKQLKQLYVIGFSPDRKCWNEHVCDSLNNSRIVCIYVWETVGRLTHMWYVSKNLEKLHPPSCYCESSVLSETLSIDRWSDLYTQFGQNNPAKGVRKHSMQFFPPHSCAASKYRDEKHCKQCLMDSACNTICPSLSSAFKMAAL